MLINEVRTYLDDLKQVHQDSHAGITTPELSYRTFLHNFLVNISAKIKSDSDTVGIVHEPSSTGKGRPDFRFHDKNSYAVYGYVECKALSESDIKWTDYREQVNKYVQLGTPVILTDGIEFLLFSGQIDSDPKLKSCLVDSKQGFLLNGSYSISHEGLDLFQKIFISFLEQKGSYDVNQRQLIELLARRASLLRDDTKYLLTRSHRGTENELISKELRDIYEVFKEQLDETLDETSFASIVGQLLIFSLLVAYVELVNSGKKPTDKQLMNFFYDNSSSQFRPLKALCLVLNNIKSDLGLIKSGWSDAALLLSFVKADIDIFGNYHDLYEEFHYAYDPEEKMDFGAYATPDYLARYAVSLSKKLVENVFQRNMFGDNVKLIDPSCGTGTYLEELAVAYEGAQIKGNCTISGIEVLPVPYSLAQIRMSKLLNSRTINLAPNIFMGNSLSDAVVSNVIHLRPLDNSLQHVVILNEEFVGLQKETLPPVMVIIGNPPSSDSGFNMGENFSEIERALDSFRPPELERSSRQNLQKSLQNDFVKFILWACIKIDQTNGGIISFIVPSSVLVDKSYVYMRQYLLENFAQIYVLEFDSDLRLTGSQGSNIFATRQGRAMITLVKKPHKPLEQRPASASVYYGTLLDRNRIEKKDWFRNNTQEPLTIYEESAPYGWLKAFKPISEDDNKLEKYQNDFYGLDQIFMSHVSGVKTGCTGLVVHTEKQTLERLLNDISSENISDDEVYEKYFKGQIRVGDYWKGWKRAYVAKEIKKSLGPKSIVSYDFRPFLKRQVFYSPVVMKEASKDGGRARPELEQVFINNELKASLSLAVATSPSLLSSELHQFVCAVENLPDNDLVSRNNSYIFPIWFPNQKSSKELRENINEEIIEQLRSNVYVGQEITYEQIGIDLIHYLLSFLCSNVYRREYENIIYHGLVKGMVRVPITKDRELFKKMADYGDELASIQFGKNVEIPTSVVVTFLKSITLKSVTFEKSKSLVILKGTNTADSIVFRNVPEVVFDYTIKGYEVAKTWFKFKQFSYLHREFNQEDVKEAIQLFGRIQAHFSKIEQIDPIVEEILSLY